MKSCSRLFLIFALVFITFSGSAAATTYLSVPSQVADDENATFIVEETGVENFNATIAINGSGNYTESLTATNGVASTTINVSQEGLSEGKYTVTVSLENNTVNFSSSSSSTFSVNTGASGAVMARLTSKTISGSDCPLAKSKSMNEECRVFGVNVTKNNNSNLTQISVSNNTLTATINTNQTYVGLVDSEESGVYDTIFWDDDNTFREENETGETEKAFLSPGDKVKEFKIGNETASLYAQIVGDNLVFGVGATQDEIPYRKGDTITYAFLAYDEADSAFGVTVDANPSAGVDIDATSTNLRTGDQKALSISNSTTNEYGFTGTGNITDAEVGRHKVNINNISSKYYEVRSFDINYDVLDASTGNRENTFQPGASVQIKAIPTLGDNQINFNSIKIDLIDSSGNKFTETLQDSTSTVFDLPENVSAGTATVTIEVEDSTGATQTASTSFEIKKFRVHTIALRNESGSPRPTDSLAPNATGYAFVGVVKLGTFGGVQEIMGADFYDINDPTTPEDECKSNVGDIRGELDGKDAVKVLNKTSMNRSSLFESMPIPEKMNTQCIVKFKVKEGVSGFFTGSVTTKRAGSNQTQLGQLTFGVSNYEMRGDSVNPNTGEHEWEFGVDQRVGIQPVITEIGTYQRINNSKIVDTSILSLEGEGNATAQNVTFNASGNNVLAFNAPDTAGNYRVNFLAEVNTSRSPPSETQTVKGKAYFGVTVFEIEADITSPQNSYQIPPKSNITVDVSVETPTGQNKSGVALNVTELRNGEQETSYLDGAQIITSGTTVNGTAKIKLIPDSEWGEGWYNARIKGTDPQGNSDYGYLYFSVDKYDVTMNKKINGEQCRYCYNSIVSGDNVQFLPEVFKTGSATMQIEQDIVLDRSSLTYYGNRRTYSSENIPLEEHAEVIGASGNQTINISTENLSAGSYGLDLKLNLTNGDTTIANSYFRLSAFNINVTRKGSQRAFQPGTNITYYISASQIKNYTVKAGTFRSYDYRTGESTEVEPKISHKSFQNTSSMAVNLTVPDTSEGYYYGNLEITSGGTTQYDSVNFEVKTLGVSLPKKAKIRYSKYSKEVVGQNPSKISSSNTTAGQIDCSNLLNNSNFTFNNGSPSGDCELSNASYEPNIDFNTLWINGSNWTDSDVYISYDSRFNEQGDIAKNLSLYEETSALNSGLMGNITDITGGGGSPYIEFTATNGFSPYSFENPIIVDNNDGADSYYASSFRESYWSLDKDLNGDGYVNNTLVTLLVNKSGTFTTRLSLDNNFTTGNSTVLLEERSGSLGGSTVYSGVFRNDSWAKYTNQLIVAEAADYGRERATKSEGANFTFPVMVSYPNGTALEGKNVSIARIVRQSDSKIFKSQAKATTDSNGVAFINTALPDLSNRASATYRVIPSTTVNSKQKTIDSYSAPVVDVSKFDQRSEKYARIDLGQMESYSDSNGTINTDNLAGNESVNLTGINSKEYRFTNTNTTETASKCYDLNFDDDCGENVSVLLYQGFWNMTGMDVSQGLIDDDSTLGESYGSETEGDEETIERFRMYPNLSSADFTVPTGDVYLPNNVFAVFNESSDELSLYRNQDEVYTDDNIYLVLHFTELFSRNALSGDVTVNTVSYDGETYNATKNFSKSLDSNGVALLNISRTDFTGSDTSWEFDTPVSFEGTVVGTNYQKTVQIRGDAQSTSSTSSGGGSSGTFG